MSKSRSNGKKRTQITEDYVGAGLLVESSINLTASSFLLGSKTYSISATAALCIKESAGTKKSQHVNSIQI